MTSSTDKFMMYKGLYNFQLYSLHEQSILIYLGSLLSIKFLSYALWNALINTRDTEFVQQILCKHNIL